MTDNFNSETHLFKAIFIFWAIQAAFSFKIGQKCYKTFTKIFLKINKKDIIRRRIFFILILNLVKKVEFA